MGGCRCNFRDCKVTTQSFPGMHFFRFPVNDKPRLDKWIKMAGAEHLLKLPVEQQKFKIVCGRHFRVECFMNYKMDRLVRGKAVPTLMRISAKKAFDYEQMDAEGQPKLIDLGPPTMAHLIPPPGFPCPFAFDEKDEMLAQSSISTLNRKIKDSNSISETTGKPKQSDTVMEEIFLEMAEEFENENENENEEEFGSLKRTSKTDFNENLAKKVKVIGSKTSKSIKDTKKIYKTPPKNATPFVITGGVHKWGPSKNSEYANEEVISDDYLLETAKLAVQGDSESCNENDNENDTEFVNKTLYDEMVQHYETLVEDERTKSCAEIEKLKKENSKLVKDLFKTRLSVGKVTDQYNKAKITICNLNKRSENYVKKLEELQSRENMSEKCTTLEKSVESLNKEISHLRSLKTDLETYKKKYETLTIEYNELQKKCNRLKASSQQNDVVTTSANKKSNPTSVPAPGPANKVQLFHGIKKYLNSSMIALLRMQMFGSTDRAWKSDEKQVAMDLLNLGTSVYRNFTDEWRFHLPSLSTVSKWSSEPLCGDEEDL